MLILIELAADEEVLPLDLASRKFLLEGLSNVTLIAVYDSSINELQPASQCQIGFTNGRMS